MTSVRVHQNKTSRHAHFINLITESLKIKTRNVPVPYFNETISHSSVWYNDSVM